MPSRLFYLSLTAAILAGPLATPASGQLTADGFGVLAGASKGERPVVLSVAIRPETREALGLVFVCGEAGVPMVGFDPGIPLRTDGGSTILVSWREIGADNMTTDASEWILETPPNLMAMSKDKALAMARVLMNGGTLVVGAAHPKSPAQQVVGIFPPKGFKDAIRSPGTCYEF